MQNSLTRVLVVDEDKEFLQEAMGELSGDCQVETSSTGRDALGRYEAFGPNVIILDCELSDISFAKVANQIRETDKNVIRIVLGRDYSKIERVVDAINEAHVHSFFRKPVNWVELKKTIQTKAIDYFVVKGRLAGRKETQGAYQKLETILDEAKKIEKMRLDAKVQLAKAQEVEAESFRKVKSVVDESRASRSRIKELEEMIEAHKESLRELETLKKRDVDKIEREKEEYRSKLNVLQEEHGKAVRKVEEIERALHMVEVDKESTRAATLSVSPDLKSIKREKKGGKDSILFVDDEPDIVELLRDEFEADFNVYTAESAQAAMKVLDENSDICLVVTDQKMPGMTGIELAAGVYQKRSELPFILLTGFTEFEDARKAINTGNIIRYLNKPYKTDELKDAIQNGIGRFDVATVQKNIVEDRSKMIVDEIKELAAKVKEVGFENSKHVEVRRRLEDENKRFKSDKEQVSAALGMVKKEVGELRVSVAKEREAMQAEMRARREAVETELAKKREEAEQLIAFEREKHREELNRLQQVFVEEKKKVESQIEADRKRLEAEDKQAREKFAVERARLEKELADQKNRLEAEVERVRAEVSSVKERLEGELQAELDARRQQAEAELDQLCATATRELDKVKAEKEKNERELNGLITQATRAIKERDGELALFKQRAQMLEREAQQATQEMEKHKQENEKMKADYDLVLQSREALEAELASLR